MGDALTSRYESIFEDATGAPLSKCLPAVLKFALQIGNKDLERWARLEIDGYYNTNPAMDDDVVVPKYRTVSGQHIDDYGRPLLVRDPELRFVNDDRLRNGVAELESLARSKGMLSYESPTAETINKYLSVNISRFRFHPSSIEGVLSGIRSELIQRLYEIKPEITANPSLSKIVKTNDKKPRAAQVMVGVILMVISLITLVVFSISYFIQPILPEGINKVAVLLVASLIGVIGFFAALNEVVELFQKLSNRNPSDNQE